MKKIGLFGGSFDPCHVEHEKMARAFINEMDLDELVVVPAGIPPHKRGEEITSSSARLGMLSAAFQGDKKVVISDHDVKAEGVSYTCLLVRDFAEKYADAEVFFLVGTDMLEDFPTWANPDEILKNCTLCLVKRDGEDVERAKKTYFAHFDKPFVELGHVGKDVSSTEIRARIALGFPTDGLISEHVREYIEANGLYSDEKSEFVKKNLSIKRLTHTLGVIKLAVRYAKRLKINASDAFVAAMLHDAAKYLDPADFGFEVDKDVPPAVVHQFLGAFIAENVLKVKKADIINAIRYHTTGRKDMSTLEKVVFTADLLEENREFEGVEELRKAVDVDFEKGFERCVKELYAFLIKKGGEVYGLTKECRDFYCD